MSGVDSASDVHKKNTELVEKEQSGREQEKWNTRAKEVLLDLNSSTADILDFVTTELADASASPARQSAIQLLLAERTQITTTISNVLRLIADAANQIIRNIRA